MKSAIEMQHIHAEGSVRHAEKRRNGTCQFANRIARASLDVYGRTVPQSYREASKQTCVAAIVAQFRNHHECTTQPAGDHDGNTGADCNSYLQVMGLGVGTKFLPDATLREERILGTATGIGRDNGNGADCYGKRIRDCHAEVLGQRAFKRQIAMEILTDLKSSKKQEKDAVHENSDEKSEYVPILEKVVEQGGSICYRLKSNVTLHFYASSAPCEYDMNARHPPTYCFLLHRIHFTDILFEFTTNKVEMQH